MLQSLAAVAITEQGEADVLAATALNDVVGGANHAINARLGSHDSGVDGQEGRTLLEFRAGGAAGEAGGIGSVAHNNNLFWRTAAASGGQAPKRLVGDDDQVRKPVGAALQEQQEPG